MNWKADEQMAQSHKLPLFGKPNTKKKNLYSNKWKSPVLISKIYILLLSAKTEKMDFLQYVHDFPSNYNTKKCSFRAVVRLWNRWQKEDKKNYSQNWQLFQLHVMQTKNGKAGGQRRGCHCLQLPFYTRWKRGTSVLSAARLKMGFRSVPVHNIQDSSK